MTVRAGREFLALPGPTTMPDEVLRAMHRPAIDIYSDTLPKLTAGLLADLKTLFRTEGATYIYIANGHGTWDAALSNVLSRGDKVLVLESGRFATSWGDAAARMNIEVEVLKGSWNRAVSPDAVEARLKRDTKGEIKAILVVQIDTASGCVNDIASIGRAVKAAEHDALLMVDAVASLGCMPFDMDAWGVDVTMAASQKGLMTPPGLGFIAANERARKAHEKADLRTAYWDWTLREGKEHYSRYAGTAPLQHLFGLRQAIDMIFEEGLDNVFERHRLLANAARAAVKVWTEGEELSFNISEPGERSDTVTTIRTRDTAQIAQIRGYCDRNCGVILGAGIGELTGKAFRIAHMGHINAPMLLGTLGVVEMALTALRIPHGKGGTDAAIALLGESVKA